ncbi:hypothetical protein ACSBR1_013581 [Camellia fascicularis]
MAPSWIQMGLALVLVTGFWAQANAQSGCTNVLVGMASCLSYVTGSSSSPTSSCCSKLANVVQSQPQCLCTALGGGGSVLGFNINQTLALSLPGACNVQTPPLSESAHSPATLPIGSPEGMPAGSSNGTADSPTSSSASGVAAPLPATSPVSSPEGMPAGSSNGTADSPTSLSVSGVAAHSPATSLVGSPEGMTAGSSNGTPDSPTSSPVSGAGSKTVPSGGTTSDGSTTKMPLQFVTVLFLALYVSISSKI